MFCLDLLWNGLCMFCNHQRSHTNMWVMKEYGVKESWKMFIIKYSHDFMGYDFLYLPFCMSIEGEILFKIGSVLLTYSQINDSMRFPKFQNYGHLGETKNWIERITSFGSLMISLNPKYSFQANSIFDLWVKILYEFRINF